MGKKVGSKQLDFSKKIKNIYTNTYNNIQNSLWSVFVIGALIGAVLFVALYGIRILDFTYTGWIYAQTGQDLVQHQLGFEFFRYADWQFPIGRHTSYGYPDGISVVYTDSIPLLAIFFKLFRGILPANFQYFGLWGIMSFMLQGGLSCVILKKYINRLSIIFVACPFFVYSTGVIFRMYGHTALAGHWIILLAFYICVYKEKFKSLKSRIAVWSALTALCVMVHAYFIVMIGIIMVGFLMNDFIDYKKIYRVLLIFFSAVITTLGVFWLIGGFSSSSKISESGLGAYSMNINSIFNSMGLGKILAPKPVYTPEQAEGFQYLGFGFLLLLPIAGYYILSDLFDKEQRKKINFKNLIKCIPIAFVCLALTILALSPKVTLNQRVIFDYTNCKFIMDKLAPFRATGRLFWPVFYIIVFVVIIYIAKKANFKGFVSILLIFCLGVQLYDLSPLISRHRTITSPNAELTYESPLKSDFWEKANYKHLEFLSDDIAGYEPLAIYAATNKMTMNNGNIARKDFDLISKNIKNSIQNIRNSDIDSNTMYIVPADRNFLSSPLDDEDIVELKIDGYYIFVASNTIDENQYSSNVVS